MPTLAQQLLRSLERGPDTLSSLERQYTGSRDRLAVAAELVSLLEDGRVVTRRADDGRLFYALADPADEDALLEITRLGRQASALARQLRVSFDAALKLTAVSVPLARVLRDLVRETER